MPVYTVHAPILAGADVRATDKFTFVRDGFHFWAFVLGPVWLAWHRLWLALIGWIVVIATIDFAMTALGLGGAVLLANMLLALLLGFEAASLQRWTLSRRNWRQLDIVVADDEESAERRFFDRWTAMARGSATIDRPSIAADRRRRGLSRVSPSRGRRRCRRARSSDYFRNRELRGERCHHRLRFRKFALRR